MNRSFRRFLRDQSGNAPLLTAFIIIAFFMLSAVLSMIFSRGGKRVFIAKSLNFSGLMLVLMAAFLAGFGMVFMQ